MKTFASRLLSICLGAAAVVSVPALAQQWAASAGPADQRLIEDGWLTISDRCAKRRS
jgi:hypothetical protein